MHGVSRCVLPCLVITAVSFSLAFGEDKFFDFAGVRIRYIDQGSGAWRPPFGLFPAFSPFLQDS